MLSEGVGDVWVEVGRFRGVAEAEQQALVLIASGVASRLVPHPAGVILLVAASDAMRAEFEIAAYQRENSAPPPAPRPLLRPLRDGIDGALVYAAVLVFLHAATNRGAFSLDWLSIGAADAGLIRAGEWWRVITALGLHADFGHLAGNLALGALLGVLLAQLLGSGLTWLAILGCGALGNTMTALVYPADHASIGASTAVFAALGLLAAQAWRQRAYVWRGFRRYLPVAAAIMLLALLGMGGGDGRDNTDIGAHVAGLAAGLVAGAALAFADRLVPPGRKAQIAYGLLAIAVFAGAWFAAVASASL